MYRPSAPQPGFASSPSLSQDCGLNTDHKSFLHFSLKKSPPLLKKEVVGTLLKAARTLGVPPSDLVAAAVLDFLAHRPSLQLELYARFAHVKSEFLSLEEEEKEEREATEAATALEVHQAND